ncbi:MAG: hypothetical protein ACT4OV_03040 [Microthrixaceae bacterium]
MTPEEVLVKYGRAWFERDRDQRIETLRLACAEDIVFMDPNLGRLNGLEEVADMIGGYMNPAMEGHDDEAREEHARGMSGSGVSVEVVTPIESFHRFYRYSYIWHFPDGSQSGGTSFCEQGPDGRIRLITVWPGSDHFPIPVSQRG